MYFSKNLNNDVVFKLLSHVSVFLQIFPISILTKNVLFIIFFFIFQTEFCLSFYYLLIFGYNFSFLLYLVLYSWIRYN